MIGGVPRFVWMKTVKLCIFDTKDFIYKWDIEAKRRCRQILNITDTNVFYGKRISVTPSGVIKFRKLTNEPSLLGKNKFQKHVVDDPLTPRENMLGLQSKISFKVDMEKGQARMKSSMMP